MGDTATEEVTLSELNAKLDRLTAMLEQIHREQTAVLSWIEKVRGSKAAKMFGL